MLDELVVVNKRDQVLGTKDKLECHLLPGFLHRAISVWVVDSQRKVLITRRSEEKMLWPGYWSNAVCSHPKLNESYKKAGERRLKEELGFTTSLEYLYKFVYRERFRKVGEEHELCGVLVGAYDGKVKPHGSEIADYKWIGWKELVRESEREKNLFTPWFFLERERLEKDEKFLKYIN